MKGRTDRGITHYLYGSFHYKNISYHSLEPMVCLFAIDIYSI